MSPRSILRDVTGLWAPSVLMPDENQVQVSISSTWGWLLPISRTMAWVACNATSYSGTPTAIASRPAAPPMSAMRALSRIQAISSSDFTMRMRMVGLLTSTSSAVGNAPCSLRRFSAVMWSNSMPIRPPSWISCFTATK